jgi:benzoyl-CoA reductase subunit C
MPFSASSRKGGKLHTKVGPKLKTKALEQFQEATKTLINPSLKKWKDNGGKIIGCYCSYIPEEMITAAGFVPFRMRGTGSTGTDMADTCVSSINCSFSRHSLDLGLRGEYSFLDGVVWVNSCDHVRRIYDHWKRKIDTPYLRLLSLPKKVEEPQVEWFRGEILSFRDSLKDHFGVFISDDRLWKAIKLHNETRRLQRQLYELRKKKAPPITGAETLAVMVAGTAMPRAEYNELLKELVDELGHSEGHADYRARLMLIGGILDDPAYIEVIEGQGGLVVTDSLCFGARLMWKGVDEKADDPISALARYYIADRPSCARMFGDEPRRSAFIQDMVREFKVDGVVAERLVMCDLWTGEQFMIGEDLKEAGVPYIRLDRDYISIGAGQLKTRVQAFLEMMGR